MSKSKQAAAEMSDEQAVLRSLARNLDILVRVKLWEIKGARSQNEVISMLDEVGCGQTEIANLLGTTANTVNVALYKAKKKAAKK